MKPLDPRTVEAHAKIEAKMREQAKKRQAAWLEKKRAKRRVKP